MSQTDPHRADPIPRLIWAIVALCLGLEAFFTLTEQIPLGLAWMRRWALAHGAFWPGLLGDWNEVYPGQRYLMFLSYALLHGGLMHVVFNMLVFVHLGREALERLGAAGFLLLCLFTAVGGALAYGLYPRGDGPMVGASGVVFGLLGAMMWWDWSRQRAAGASTERIWRMMLGLVLLNAVLWFLVDGHLAWQAHLGGWLAGLGFARFVTPTPKHFAGQADKPGRRRGFH